MNNKTNHSEHSGKQAPRKRQGVLIRQEPHNDADDLTIPKIPNAERHVDEMIRKYSDFPIIDRD